MQTVETDHKLDKMKQRQVKNRESAARSREKKQRYISELEAKVRSGCCIILLISRSMALISTLMIP